MNNQEYNGGMLPVRDPAADKKSFSMLGFALLTAYAAHALLTRLAAFLAQKYAPGLWENGYFYWGVYILALYIVGMPLGVLLMRRAHSEALPPLEERKLSLSELLFFWLCTFPLAYAGNLVGNLLNGFVSAFSGKTSNIDLDALLGQEPMWLTFVMMVIAAPVMEELFFRRFLVGTLRPWGWKTAILVSGFAFGLFHGNLQQFCYATLVGMLFAYVYLKTGKLIYTILLHVAMNLLTGFFPSYVMTYLLDVEGLAELLEQFGGVTELTEEVLSAFSDTFTAFAETNYLGIILFSLYALVTIGLQIAGAVLLIVNLRRIRLEGGTRSIEKKNVGDVIFMAPGVILFIFASIAMAIYGVVRG